jgi:hypothetical protein
MAQCLRSGLCSTGTLKNWKPCRYWSACLDQFSPGAVSFVLLIVAAMNTIEVMTMPINTENGISFTLEEASEYLGHPVVSLRTYIRRKLIFPRKIGPAVLIDKNECDRFRREKRPPGRPPQK